jgi:hypothetical protein
MPSLKLVDTSLDPVAAPRRWLARILASLGVALFPLLVGATLDAQEAPSPPQEPQQPAAPKPEPAKGAKGKKKHEGAKAKAPAPEPEEDAASLLREAFGSPGASTAKPALDIVRTAGKKKGAKGTESATAPAAPKGLPRASTTPPPVPVDKAALAKLAEEQWTRVTDTLLVECLARDPERAFEQPWLQISSRSLGTFGGGATMRWRRTLTDSLAELQRFDTASLQWQARAQLKVLVDWIEAELLMLDAQTPSTSDPAGYVERAFLALRAAREARWMSDERRENELESLLAELPAYFEDARLSLINPSARWIDFALADLDDLEELVSAIEKDSGPKAVPRTPKGRKAAASDADPLDAVEAFRTWLLELRPSAGGRVPSLNEGEWQRLVSLRSGTTWAASELKARCLRELARLDLGARVARAPSPGVDGVADVAGLAWDASERALELGKKAHFLGARLDPKAVSFELETATRTAAGIARLVNDGDASRVFLAEPHGSWPAERTIARSRGLLGAPTALGVRYGMAGEALHALQSRTAKRTVAVLLDNRLLREGLGLYALDWTGRVARAENPFRGDEALSLEFELQKGLEAARMVAAIELHAEGLAVEDAALGFSRRTGVDRETAMAEAIAAERDPLRGIGYLGLIELQALETRLTQLTGPRRGLNLCMKFASGHPDLRPSEGVRFASSSQRKAGGKKSAAKALENQGAPQQELTGSR